MTLKESYLDAMDVYNEVELCWGEIESRAFTAKYPGYDRVGQRVRPGDKIAKLTVGGYILVAPHDQPASVNTTGAFNPLRYKQ